MEKWQEDIIREVAREKGLNERKALQAYRDYGRTAAKLMSEKYKEDDLGAIEESLSVLHLSGIAKIMPNKYKLERRREYKRKKLDEQP